MNRCLEHLEAIADNPDDSRRQRCNRGKQHDPDARNRRFIDLQDLIPELLNVLQDLDGAPVEQHAGLGQLQWARLAVDERRRECLFQSPQMLRDAD